MKKLLWYLLSKVDDNWGYSTPLQKRFKVGDKVNVSFHIKSNKLIPYEPVTIIECCRHDYLVEDAGGELHEVYQFELY